MSNSAIKLPSPVMNSLEVEHKQQVCHETASASSTRRRSDPEERTIVAIPRNVPRASTTSLPSRSRGGRYTGTTGWDRMMRFPNDQMAFRLPPPDGSAVFRARWVAVNCTRGHQYAPLASTWTPVTPGDTGQLSPWDESKGRRIDNDYLFACSRTRLA